MKINDNGIDRDATPEEIKEINKAQAEASADRDSLLAQVEAAAAAKVSARAKLKALGLTDDEIAALVG